MRQLGIAGSQLDQPIEAARPRHRQIQEHEVELLGCLSRTPRADSIEVASETTAWGNVPLNDELERLDEEGMVVDDQNADRQNKCLHGNPLGRGLVTKDFSL